MTQVQREKLHLTLESDEKRKVMLERVNSPTTLEYSSHHDISISDTNSPASSHTPSPSTCSTCSALSDDLTSLNSPATSVATATTATSTTVNSYNIDEESPTGVPSRGSDKSISRPTSYYATTPNEKCLHTKLLSNVSSKTVSPGDSPNSVVSAAAAAAAALKSPTSPPSSTDSKLGKLTRVPCPPRPLVPRRQPSFSTSTFQDFGPHSKTLIVDLDETLIHSVAKGGRFTSGHMVEVRVTQPLSLESDSINASVPILYYVHKRPHCDEFLRKVSKWYKLVVFTASAQEYADPVIDWLELERKYFQRRYYRHHCTYRNGAFIKDLSQVEPDLSKVVIVDNSPISYIFHEDNAIPIEGWINDPTDNNLLNLIPLLEGLQYVTDVRSFLTLRLGQRLGES